MTSQTPSPTHLRTLYRNLLRHLPPRPVLSSPRAPLHQALRSAFEQPLPVSPPVSTAATTSATPAEYTRAVQAAQAEQYLAFLKAQQTYVELLERYNPGMYMEQDEKVRLSARKVGLELPKQFGEEGEGEDGEKQ
ncbi:uncharacterized protein CTHT_0043610 [Thermochaetoides thermophila DSM 1495]|uniref:Uncharacterized protein n=1 Tax=Chaetomium thermophilum (strain DSM 1495 / CBS 144.50 / IMI 039719) TaxID=759272 RepID=G0S8W0_CHATD|nr:hypothetical protein CTHT_0043610 [Thermochaetoides thermophila DSM 1495]EGS19871.1 hypothetical protein CTHT_0043610 [Thermochaetoides thermophila DSM 1495]